MREELVLPIVRIIAAGTHHIYDVVTVHLREILSSSFLEEKLRLTVVSDGTYLAKPQPGFFTSELLTRTHISQRFKHKLTHLCVWIRSWQAPQGSPQHLPL